MPPRNHYLAAVSAYYTALNWNAEDVVSSALHVQFSRAFSASISNVNIAFCAICNIFDRLFKWNGLAGRRRAASPTRASHGDGV